MEHLLHRSKRSIFNNILKYVVFQRHQKALFWSKGLNDLTENKSEKLLYSALFDGKPASEFRNEHSQNSI